MYNALLGRKQFVIDVSHTKRGTIPKSEIRTKIAEMYKVSDENSVAVFGFKNHFGGGKITGFGLVYDSVCSRGSLLTLTPCCMRHTLPHTHNRSRRRRRLSRATGCSAPVWWRRRYAQQTPQQQSLTPHHHTGHEP